MPEPAIISKLDTKDIIIVAGAAGAIIAACVSATFLIFNGWRQRVADSKRHRADSEAASERHLRELALQAALAEVGLQVAAADKWNALKSHEQEDTPRPKRDDLNLLWVEKLALLQQFGKGDLTTQELEKRIKSFSEISDNLREE